MWFRDVNKSVNKRADELNKILHIRFEGNLKMRILNQSKHNHWSILRSKKYNNYCSNYGSFWSCEAWFRLSWWRNNTPICTKKYLPTANFESNIQGAYLYYDLNDKKLIRSGKVARRGFDIRHK